MCINCATTSSGSCIFIKTTLQCISLAFIPSSSPHVSKNPSHCPLGHGLFKSVAICFPRSVGGKEVTNCSPHLGSLGTCNPWGAALADTPPVVLWQLFASQAQSLLLMTTVAMPVFSKKNETVSEAWAPCSSGTGGCGTSWGSKAKGPLKKHSALGKAAG